MMNNPDHLVPGVTHTHEYFSHLLMKAYEGELQMCFGTFGFTASYDVSNVSSERKGRK